MDDPFIVQALAKVKNIGMNARLLGAMREAETITTWLVVLEEMLIASRLPRGDDKQLRPFVVVAFLERCPFERARECLHRELPRCGQGKWLYERALADLRLGRSEWRRYQAELKDAPPEEPVTLQSALPDTVVSKLIALRESLVPAQ